MTNIVEKIKITCKCGFESVFIGIPKRAVCAQCNAKIVEKNERWLTSADHEPHQMR